MRSCRADVKAAALLVGAVVSLDLLWSLLVGSTGTLAYGLVDWPAHLATCAVGLLAIAALTGVRPPSRFVAAALVASVAVDIDHAPGYLGSHALTGSLPRPYTHSLLLVAALGAVGWAARRTAARQIFLGLAFGVLAHLFRDLATGPGVPLGWPVSDGIASIPYALYAGALVLAAALVALPRRLAPAVRLGLTAALGALLLAAPTQAAARTVSIGAYISGADNNPSLIDDFDASVGRQAAVILTYKDWSAPPFVPDQLQGIWNRGAVPMVTWEPWGVSLKRVAQGDYDGYLNDAARAAAAWDKPLMIRFAQEMNGDWFPWAGHPAAYRAAWRHLVGVFRTAGADKVRWAWVPYVNSRGGRLPFAAYFPGEKWVDWVGLDAVNWGGSSPWRTFRQIAGRSYQQMKGLTRRPMILAETGSGEEGGSKAHWLSRMLRRNVPRMGRVRALAFWSSDDPRGDLRVDSSSAALDAVRGALSEPLYRSSRGALLDTPARLGR